MKHLNNGSKIIKIEIDFLFFSHFFAVHQKGSVKAFKPSQNLFEAPQKSMKIKFYVNISSCLGLQQLDLSVVS